MGIAGSNGQRASSPASMTLVRRVNWWAVHALRSRRFPERFNACSRGSTGGRG